MTTRRTSHLTPRYLVDRARLALRERHHPDAPWLVSEAVDLLGQWLRPDDVVIEWGSGRSTTWFLDHGARVHAVEHHEGWAETVRTGARGRPLELVVVDPDDPDGYAGAHPELDAVDVALVDGIHRHQCTARAVELVRPGGLLVVDNVERYLPSESRAPEAIGASGLDPAWRSLAPVLAEWRGWWYSDGVTDTAIWIRP